jgi:hypothetical protein
MKTDDAPILTFPIDPGAGSMIGCDELRDWLTAQGFRAEFNHLGSRDNGCNWYAYRRSTLPARECECNEGKTVQLVVRPFAYRRLATGHPGFESVEVDVTGEAGGVWFKLTAYSLKHDELRERLDDIEASLIAAWNALAQN